MVTSFVQYDGGSRSNYLDMKPQLIQLSVTHAVSRVCQQLQVVCHLKTILQHFACCTNIQHVSQHQAAV